jgi:hypothetical protein
MPISQVALSNTFNEFRSTFNDAANTVNSLTGGGGNISANSITSSTLTSGRVPLVSTAGLIIDDSNLTYNTSTDVLTLGGSITLGTLTSGRVPLVSTAGLIVDDSNLTYNTSTDVLTLGGTTDASSNTTGTLIVTGGVGVAKKLYVGTDLAVTANTTLSGTTDSSSSTTGAVIISGGAGVAKNLYVGGNTIITDTTQSTSTTTGSLQTAGGAGVAKNLFVGGIVDITDTTQSTSVTTGALIVDGGAGIAKNVYVGGDMQVTGNLTILGTNTSISTTYINIDDNMLQLANNNVANTVDIGFYGQYSDGAGNVHSGLFRDATDGIWKFFKDYNIEPGTTINISGNGFAFANVQAGNVTATKFFGDGSGLSGVATSGGGSTITDDTTTNASYYVGMANTTSGTQSNTFIATTKLFFNPSTGTLNATNFNSLSDEASKSNVTPIVNATDVIRALDGVEFDWVETGQKSSGVIAQRIEIILPHLVTTNEYGVKSVNYQGITAYLIEAFKEIDTRLQNLEKK